MNEESQYKKYTLVLNGKSTFVYASKHLSLKEAKEDIKNRFAPDKVRNVRLA